MPKIDIIASIFNADNFLEGYFNDLVSQSFFSECRLILVAPNPSKKLLDLSSSVNELYGNIDLIALTEDPGISNCINKAIQYGHSKYLTIANVDDRRWPDSLLRHYLELEANEDVDLVYSQSLLSTVPNETFLVNSCKSIYPCYDFDGLAGLIRHNSPHHNPMWRRSIHDKNGYFDESLKSAADGDLWMRCVVNGSKFKMIKEILGIYYFNPDGASTNNARAAERAKEEREVKQKYIDIYNEKIKSI